MFTAHDLLPRRTAREARASGARLFERFDRVVVHSERGRETLGALGVPEQKLRVIPHPVFPSDPPRRDDGRTVLALGAIRPYKGLEHAIEAARRAGARLLVAGDPRSARPRSTAREWRLGYLAAPELERALGEATVAVFPYRPSSTRAARCCRRSAPACRPSSTTSAASASSSRASAPGGSCRPDDVDALAAALQELLDDPSGARGGTRRRPARARGADVGRGRAQAHLALYEELV